MTDCGALRRRGRVQPFMRRLLPFVALPALVFVPAAAAQDLAFVSERDGNAEIYVTGADGAGQRNLTNDPAEDQAPAWSADGARIAFVRGFGPEAEVWDMAADGGGPRRLTTNDEADRA